MATVNKDFKIKSGLIVEGTTGTINGYNILTESQDSQDFIIDIIGGETLITSVESTQLEVISGELNVKSGVFDAAGAADAAETAANSYTDGRETAITSAYQTYADDAADAAETAANSYTDGRETAITSAYQTYADQSETDAVSTANSYTDGRETAITTAYQSYADTAEQDAKNYADGLAGNYDAAGAAATAEQNAKDYADDLINDASSSSAEVWSAYKTGTEIGLAQTAAETYADNAVAALVDAAPAMLDTLNELAAALGDDEDFIGTVNAAIGEKVAKSGDTMTGELILSADPTQTLAAATKQYVDGKASDAYNDAIVTAADDATTKANAAEANAEDYADGLISTEVTNRNSAISTAKQEAIDAAALDATSKADAAEDAANGYTDSAISTEVTNRNTAITDAVNALDTDDIEEGLTNQYFTDSRAKTSAADLLTGASLTNITITGTGAGLTITAENGVADSTTDDLTEGEENLYFTDERAIDAVSNADIYPNAVIVDNIAKQVASQITAATAGIQVGHAFAKADYRSAEFLVKVAYGSHTEISKVLLTLDTSDNIAITEYGIVGTNGSASTISADISGTDVRLLVTTANNNSTVTVMGTLLV
jgi:hypothetical protein